LTNLSIEVNSEIGQDIEQIGLFIVLEQRNYSHVATLGQEFFQLNAGFAKYDFHQSLVKQLISELSKIYMVSYYPLYKRSACSAYSPYALLQKTRAII